jgi:hypothetical protein
LKDPEYAWPARPATTEQAKQGDELVKAAAELLEQHKNFTDEDNYMTARGLLTM